MHHFAITPQEALNPRIVSVEEQLSEAVKTLLSSRYKGDSAVIFQEDIVDLIGSPRWNVAEHPRKLAEIVELYKTVGWNIVDSSTSPHRRSWSFSAKDVV